MSAHPRRANKYSSCLGLGLVHQLMNLEAGIKFALLLNRTYLPWPLVQASRFTSGAPPVQLKFATVVNLQGLPVNESLPWPSPGPNVQHGRNALCRQNISCFVVIRFGCLNRCAPLNVVFGSLRYLSVFFFKSLFGFHMVYARLSPSYHHACLALLDINLMAAWRQLRSAHEYGPW